ncbi:putative Alcohol dehydrogenase protein [Seiridium unicorne]|uniref:Alcohol dehydrogenase protein n=1 Tax=Seiridium unicorne TaxID=138068 RepID=A0ABR2V6A9_9PEZI
MVSFTVFKGQESGIAKKSQTTKPDQLTGDNVLIQITASGVCGTEKKGADMVLGHEGVGIVAAVGPEARYIKAGDRVGWGYEVNSCGHCIDCLEGAEPYCAKREIYGTANADQGSFASHAIWSESFLHAIPEGISDEAAAPLVRPHRDLGALQRSVATPTDNVLQQCGGATTYTALHGVKPSDTVGIIGVGGLGHLAIQFAAKMGCRVVVLSGSDSKRDEALKLGAHEFIATRGVKELKVSTPINRLLVTTAAQPNWEQVLPIMATRSTIYPLSVSFEPLKIPNMPVILQGIAVQGSLVAPRSLHRQMLEFAALHKIAPIVEKFPMSEEGIKAAFDKLEEGDVHFRAVLVN